MEALLVRDMNLILWILRMYEDTESLDADYIMYFLYIIFFFQMVPHIYHTCPKFWTNPSSYLLICLKISERVANSVDLIRRRVMQLLILIYTVCSDQLSENLGLRQHIQESQSIV